MKKVLSILSLASVVSCTSQYDTDLAQSVVTALPHEVQDCTFIDDVDISGAFNIQNARFFLKVKTAELGGTHLVMTQAFPVQMSFHCDLGVGMTGRAYKCPAGKGPLLEKAQNRSVMYDETLDSSPSQDIADKNKSTSR